MRIKVGQRLLSGALRLFRSVDFVKPGARFVLPIAALLTIPSVFAQPPPMEVIRSQCGTMQNIIDDLAADHADPARVARRDKKISRSIQDSLAASDVDEVEKLFRCFEFHERIELPERAIWTYIPVAILTIPMTAEKREYAELTPCHCAPPTEPSLGAL